MRSDMRRDLKARDRVAVSALRSALAAIENAEAPVIAESGATVATSEHVAGSVAGQGASEVAPRELSETDIREIVEQEVHERDSTATEYEGFGRDDLAATVRSEAEVLRRYIPAHEEPV